MTRSLSSCVLLILVADFMTVFRTEVAAEIIFKGIMLSFWPSVALLSYALMSRSPYCLYEGTHAQKECKGINSRGRHDRWQSSKKKRRRRQWFTQVLYLRAHLRYLYFACVFYNVLHYTTWVTSSFTNVGFLLKTNIWRAYKTNVNYPTAYTSTSEMISQLINYYSISRKWWPF